MASSVHVPQHGNTHIHKKMPPFPTALPVSLTPKPLNFYLQPMGCNHGDGQPSYPPTQKPSHTPLLHSTKLHIRDLTPPPVPSLLLLKLSPRCSPWRVDRWVWAWRRSFSLAVCYSMPCAGFDLPLTSPSLPIHLSPPKLSTRPPVPLGTSCTSQHWLELSRKENLAFF